MTRPREGADNGANFVARGQPMADCDFNQAALHQLTPSSAERARRERRHPKASTPQKSLSPLMMWTGAPGDRQEV